MICLLSRRYDSYTTSFVVCTNEKLLNHFKLIVGAGDARLILEGCAEGRISIIPIDGFSQLNERIDGVMLAFLAAYKKTAKISLIKELLGIVHWILSDRITIPFYRYHWLASIMLDNEIFLSHSL